MILVFDADDALRRVTCQALEAAGREWRDAASEEELMDLLDGPEGVNVETVLYDLGADPRSGATGLAKLIAGRPGLKVVALSAGGAVSAAVSAMKAGASDFIAQPAAPRKILAVIDSVGEGAERKKPAAAASPTPRVRPSVRPGADAPGFDGLIAESAATRRVIEQARRGARSNIPVLIEGESGVGKEVFAKAIHAESARAEGPYVAVNCGALPEALVESILFGHEKGAFTGAVERRIGKFEEAHGGSLFLDEVGELPLDAQVKLLRAIQEGEVDPVGGSRTVRTDIRVISATNRNLELEVQAGRFREDLFYRLSVYPLTLSPLRERREEILPLARLFAARFAEAEGRDDPGFTSEAEAALLAAEWRGNVRELENATYRAMVLSEGQPIRPEDYPSVADRVGASLWRPEPDLSAEAGAERDPQRATHPFFGEDGHIRSLAEIEADALDAALARYGGSMSEAARRLGIGRSTLYRKTKGADAA